MKISCSDTVPVTCVLCFLLACQSGVEKPSGWATGFQVFSTIQGKTMTQPFLLPLLWGYIRALSRPCTRPAHVAESGSRAQVQVLKNSGSLICERARVRPLYFFSTIFTFFCQTRYTKILEYNPFINICYRIGHSLELKYFHFTQWFSLNAHQAADQPQKLRTENLKFRTYLWDRVTLSYGLLVSNTLVSVDDLLQGRIAQKSLNRKSKLVLSMLMTQYISLQGFQT